MKLVTFRRRALAAGAVLSTAALLTACTPPGSDRDTPSGDFEAITAPVTTEQIAALGDVTLKVWADSGEQVTLDDFVPAFENRYPNVKVEVTIKSFDDIIKTVVNAMDSKNGPDLAEGNQGYQTDGTLVKAGLLRPIDDIAKAYGWSDLYSAYSLDQFRWNDDGTKWGAGTLYGNNPTTQYIGVFYNLDLLNQAGVQPPQSYAELEASLPVLKDAGITPVVFGNADKQAAMHIFGSLAGRCQSADDINDWVAGVEGATFVNDCNLRAAQTIEDWVAKGYVSDGFNGTSMDDAAAKFGDGQGAYFVAGDWFTQQLVETGKNFGFTVPTGDNGKRVSTGSSGMGWHINAKSEVALVAAAFIGELHSADYGQKLADQARVPIADPTATVSNPLMADDIASAGLLFADNGQTAYLDWATDTMYDVFGSGLQQMMAGQITAAEFLDLVQSDWDNFQSSK
ncbi:MAG: extracellular solute-binding protein [Cryobacterium sp.]|nr:extracellular solute-binding protein [Cryobacterium sp.]